jgi:hypothetical protein
LWADVQTRGLIDEEPGEALEADDPAIQETLRAAEEAQAQEQARQREMALQWKRDEVKSLKKKVERDSARLHAEGCSEKSIAAYTVADRRRIWELELALADLEKQVAEEQPVEEVAP